MHPSVVHLRLRLRLLRAPLATRATAIAATAVLLVGTMAGTPARAYAEPPPPAAETVEVVHDPGGRLTATLASSDPTFDPAMLAAFVDGLPVAARVIETRRRPPAAVLLAIDTSGSMEGTPLVAAQDAAGRLLQRLPPGDRVGLVSFAGWPLLLAGFTTDRNATRGGLAGLAAVGETALYDAVALASDLLRAQAADARRVLVLLSDGRDSVSASAERAAATIDAVTASGVEVYAFGLGEDIDTAYLEQLARASGGASYAVADEASLGSLFAALGTRLGDRYVVEIPVPPLSTGAHVLSLRTGAADVGIEASFAVSNEGLFDSQLVAADAAEPGAPLVIEIEGRAPAGTLDFDATLEGASLPVVDRRVYIDPWLVAPGSHSVRVRALIGGAVAATQEVLVDVPALAPEITTTLDENRQLEVRARVQGAAPLITVRAADRPNAPPLAQTTGVRLTTDLPATAGSLVIEIRGAGDVIARREFDAPVVAAAGGAGLWPGVLALAAAVLLGGIAATFALRRGRQRRQHSAVRVRARRIGIEGGSAPPAPGELGSLVVRAPDGDERSFAIGPRPLTIGRSPACDVVLADASIRPVHSRISGRGRGEFHVHGLRPATHADRSPMDDWTVLRGGESIMVGEHVLTVLDRVVAPGVAS